MYASYITGIIIIVNTTRPLVVVVAHASIMCPENYQLNIIIFIVALQWLLGAS